MEFLYPNFERHSILKKELLNSVKILFNETITD